MPETSPPTTATMNKQTLPLKTLEDTLRVYCLHSGNQTEAAKALGIGREALQNRIRRCREAGLTVPEFPRTTGGTVAPAAPQTLDEQVALHRAEQKERYAASRLKDALGEMSRLQDEIRDLRWASNAGFKPAEWTLRPHDLRKGKSEHTPYLLTSDFQAGEVVKADETEAGYGYDSDLFRERYRKMVQTTIDLSFGHAGEGWTYPGIIYARGGDAISGGIHEELADTDDMTPIEAVQCVFEEEAAGIAKLAEAFGKVDVKTVPGNHDRTTFKPRSKNVLGHSYDTLVDVLLQREFRNDKRVNFQCSKTYDVYFPIYDMKVLLTHGDRIGSRGGQGFVGPTATIMRGAQKVIAEQAALGRHVDRVDVGHFHTPFYAGWVLANGCLPGYSEYAKSFRMRPSDPQQFLLFHHPKRGVVDIRPINLR
jgi:biotin operon repressor